jgi:hypothetical protein
VTAIPLTDAFLHRTLRVLCVRRVLQGTIFQMLISPVLYVLMTQILMISTTAIVHVIVTTTTAKISSTSVITNAQLKTQSVGYTWCEITCERNQYAVYSDMSTLTPTDLST